MKKIIILLFAFIGIITLTSMFVLNQSKFGKIPENERLKRILKSPNYRDGEFKNIQETSVISEDKSRFGVMMDFMFKKKVHVRPDYNIPVVVTDIKAISPEDDVLIWFGHSSYFLRIQGKTFLIDPVFSDYASPFSFVNRAFDGTSVYHAEDLPAIDFLIITHDHWDHLDYYTVMKLKSQIKNVVCGLGVGEDFEYWGFDKSMITELDWYEGVSLGTDWMLTATPAQHYSGRALKNNQTLWVSYVLQSPASKIYVGGDSGYGTHFYVIGKQYGPFDLVILEQGQYDENWNQIHLLPNELLKAAADLQTKRILPVHNSKFSLANHPWDEPLNKLSDGEQELDIPILTPIIGEVVYLNDSTQTFRQWWKNK